MLHFGRRDIEAIAHSHAGRLIDSVPQYTLAPVSCVLCHTCLTRTVGDTPMRTCDRLLCCMLGPWSVVPWSNPLLSDLRRE